MLTNMIKFFKKLRKKMIDSHQLKNYMFYALGEVLLVSVGILLALQINNWNNNIQQKELHLQLIDLLISDLEESRDEHLSDLKFNEITLNMLNHTIDYYKQNQKIDTLNLKNILNLLGTDIFFQNESSPIYEGLSSTNLWTNMPVSITKKVGNIYRVRIMKLKLAFAKASEYGSYCKINFLVPNNLLNLNEDIKVIHSNILNISKEYIDYCKLLKNSATTIDKLLELSALDIDSLINDLKEYKKQVK